jgi:hypothetical protein
LSEGKKWRIVGRVWVCCDVPISIEIQKKIRKDTDIARIAYKCFCDDREPWLQQPFIGWHSSTYC